jgi:hypothetical protein
MISTVYQRLQYLSITLFHRSGPQKMVGFQALKRADVGITAKSIAGAGKVAFTPMNRRIVIASFVTDAGIDNPRDLRRALPSVTMADLVGQKSALGRAPGHLHPALCHLRGNRLTDYPHAALRETPHRQYFLVAAMELLILVLILATRVTVTTITRTPDMILLTTGVMTSAVTIAENRRRITMRATTTTPQGHHIVTTTIGVTKGTLMDPGMSPLAAGLWPMITVQFPHDNPPWFDFRARHRHAQFKHLLSLDLHHLLPLLILNFKDDIQQFHFLSRKNPLHP